jgi:hypothetical protein
MKKIYIKPQVSSMELLGGRLMGPAVSTGQDQTPWADVKGHHKGGFSTDEFWQDDVKKSNEKMTDKYVF